LEQHLSALKGSSAKQLVDSVHNAVQEFAVGAPQSDDITVLALRFVGPQ
jgi:serine phosphatase RsbU (regulator of sigma subunit)